MKRFIFLFFISFNFLSCHPPEVLGPEEDFTGHFALIGPEEVKVANVDIDVDMDVFVFNKRADKHMVHLICRSMDGCLRVCKHLNKKHCKKQAVRKVVKLWREEIASYQKWDQALADLTLIATDPDVSAFLKNADKKNTVLEKLFQHSRYANCPQAPDLTKELKLATSHTVPSASLLFLANLSAEEEVETNPCALNQADQTDMATNTADQADENAEQATDSADQEQAPTDENTEQATDSADQEQAPTEDENTNIADQQASAQDKEQAEQCVTPEPNLKKIVDGTQTPFNPILFHGFIKQCFGHETKTFSEMAAQIENKDAVKLAYKLISKACGNQSDCIRLAYCSISNEQVWDYLPEKLKKAGCEYSSFNEVM